MNGVKKILKKLLTPRQFSLVVKAENSLRYFCSRRQGVLPYLEFHLTDHCNLNCKGCLHFCPIAEKYYLDPSRYAKDAERLSVLFKNILTISLMGGEPLLHPRVCDFFKITRKIFPLSKIVLVTNGILLPAMQESFWESCKENKIVITVSQYPIELQLDRILGTGAKKGVRMRVEKGIDFFALMNIQGDSCPEEAMRYCRGIFFCPNLREGKIYPCPVLANVQHFNLRFGVRIPEDGCLDLYSSGIDRDQIYDFLTRPNRACSFCATKSRSFEWGISRQEQNEW